MIKIDDFLNNYVMKLEDVKRLFDLERQFDVSMTRTACCENCGASKSNTRSWNTTPWTGLKNCNMCNRLIVTHYQDAMGGVREDVICVYKERI